jgi:hypothetical protein
MNKIFDKITKLIHIVKCYDVTPGHLTPEAIKDRLSKFIFSYDEPCDGKIRSVEGINLTFAKIDAGKDYLLIDFRNVYRNASDYFETEDIPNLHTYILEHNYKVFVNQEVLEKITSVCPEFFDKMDIAETLDKEEGEKLTPHPKRITGYLSKAAGGKNMQYAASSVTVLNAAPKVACPTCGFEDFLTVKKCKKCGMHFD